jgi:hypothetical protein
MKRCPMFLGVTLAVVSLIGCGSTEGVADGPMLSVGDDPGSVELALLTGDLMIDEDTGCLVVDGGGGATPVVWPSGTTWRADPPTVVLKGGSLLPVGETIQVGGGANELDHVEDVAGVHVRERAKQCSTAGARIFMIQTVVTPPVG